VIGSIWRDLPGPNRRWIVVNALIATALINVVLNVGIDLLSVAGKGPIPLWEPPLVRPSTAWTLIGTLFLLPFFTCLLATTAVRSEVRDGKLESVKAVREHGRLASLPASRRGRGVAFGLAALATLGPPLLLAMTLLDFPDLSHSNYIAYQVVFAVALGAVVTPLIAVRAMADEPE